MSLIVQLSDLHLLARDDSEQAAIFDSLLEALRGELEARAAAVDLVAITGDVFDSGSDDPKVATARFDRLFRRLQDVLGGDVMTVIVPGNHDRRRGGLFAPHREELFCELRDVLGTRAFVHGCRTPFLSALVPHESYDQPFWVVAYDSSYLPRGLISAGGALRERRPRACCLPAPHAAQDLLAAGCRRIEFVGRTGGTCAAVATRIGASADRTSRSRRDAAPAPAAYGLVSGVNLRAVLDKVPRCDYENHMRAASRKTVGARELKTRLGTYLRAVRSGATILVTERGEPVAEIRPLPRGSGGVNAALDRLAALGMLTRGSGQKLDSFAPIRIRGRAASEVIRSDREDRF